MTINTENTKLKHRSSNNFLQELSSTIRNIVWRFQSEFKSPALQCQHLHLQSPALQNLVSHNLCQNATVLHGKIRELKRVICMQTLHRKIGRISLDRATTTNSTSYSTGTFVTPPGKPPPTKRVD